MISAVNTNSSSFALWNRATGEILHLLLSLQYTIDEIHLSVRRSGLGSIKHLVQIRHGLNQYLYLTGVHLISVMDII